MDTRVALIGIIVENMDSTPELNKLLHENGSYIMHFPGKSADLMESRQRRCIRMLAWHKLAWI